MGNKIKLVIEMKAIEVMAKVDEQQQLRAALPADAPSGQVRVLVLWPEELNGANGAVKSEEAPSDEENEKGWDTLIQLIQECQMDTGIEDLAHQHDHYLYGTPKRKD
jgi:hypothetical protein